MPLQRLYPSTLIAESKAILVIALLHPRDCLAFHPQHGGGCVLLTCRSRRALDHSELPLRGSPVKLRPHLAGTRLPHAPFHGRLQDCPFILNRRTLEDVIAGVGHDLLSHLERVHLASVSVSEGFRYNPIDLMTILRGKLSVSMQHLCRRLDFLGITSSVRGDLGRTRSLAADLFKVRLDLLAAWAGSLQVLRAVTLDLRLAMFAALDLIAKVLQAAGQLRAVDRC